jgi:hypothetical protein
LINHQLILAPATFKGESCTWSFRFGIWFRTDTRFRNKTDGGNWMDLKFHLLSAELRLKIWACAVEPRIIILDDVVRRPGSHPLPSVTQLNCEARTESRKGYESVGQGSYINFAKDILVCDADISDRTPSKSLQELAPRIQRLTFWDCFPDDGRVYGLRHYSSYVTACYQQQHFGKVEFNKFLFPNLRDLWVVKVGDVDDSWRIEVNASESAERRQRKTARHFRYWVNDSVIEMAALDLDEPDTKEVLRRGRCGKQDCRELNHARCKTISKISFMDGSYPESEKAADWVRILPWSAKPERGKERDTVENRLRWIMVERTLTFSLRWDGEDEGEDEEPDDHQIHRDAQPP